jgi:hypothetical protein
MKKKQTSAKARVSLLDLDRTLNRGKGDTERSQSLGTNILKDLDLMKGRRAPGRTRGLAALLGNTGPSALEDQSVQSTFRDTGSPIRVSGPASEKSNLVAEKPLPMAASIWALPSGEPTEAFTVERFDQESPVPPANLTTSSPAPTGPAISGIAAIKSPAGASHDAPLGLDLSAAAANALSPDADSFEKEIHAILSGAKTRPASPGLQSAASEEAIQPALSSHPHDIFEQMGRNMAFATEFRLPSVALSRTFDAIEADLAREDREQRAKPEAGLSLSNDDIESALAGIGAVIDAQPSASPPRASDLIQNTPPATGTQPALKEQGPSPSKGNGGPTLSEPSITPVAIPEPTLPTVSVAEPSLPSTAVSEPTLPSVSVAGPELPPTLKIGE